ncbi:ABC-2 type transport system permease protein [Streptomyces umbrinus]|uniref:Transport permease protein n=1 Tax=Streptomyces umbrinus TaxID=67370 RepID=A0ABU0SN65_9ACTN|nr:ABC transporter permease [Streptomyces umbrinus]MDQ1024727.1 ABC-2 type transport system permease protein [Streptomyces umbrinus]
MVGTLQRNTGASVTLRLFFVAGWRSHMALFRWMRPSAFFPTVIGVPTVQLIWFVHLGHYVGSHPVAYYAVGNALHACAIAGLFAPAMSIQGERLSGTLTAVLATPARRGIMFLGRVVPAVLIGFLTSVVMFAFGTLVAGVELPWARLPQLAGAVLVTATSCSAFGLLIGAIGLRTREAILIANLTSYFMLLVCGVNVPRESLPGWLEAMGLLMPITHGLQAARDVLAGTAGAGWLMFLELLKALAYLAMALATLRLLEQSSRRHAVLDEM